MGAFHAARTARRESEVRAPHRGVALIPGSVVTPGAQWRNPFLPGRHPRQISQPIGMTRIVILPTILQLVGLVWTIFAMVKNLNLPNREPRDPTIVLERKSTPQAWMMFLMSCPCHSTLQTLLLPLHCRPPLIALFHQLQVSLRELDTIQQVPRLPGARMMRVPLRARNENQESVHNQPPITPPQTLSLMPRSTFASRLVLVLCKKSVLLPLMIRLWAKNLPTRTQRSFNLPSSEAPESG